MWTRQPGKGKRKGQVPVWIGGLDVISVGVAEHAVHGGFDIECLNP